MSSPDSHRWRLICEEALDGATNMAFDEVAAHTVATGGPRTIRVYRWEPSTLSLGYRQDPETIDWDACEREGIEVTRRPTGGGAIYHDGYGDISYSIVAPADELPGDLHTCYELLCTPILAALKRMGVPASFARDPAPSIHEPACYLRELHPTHDVVVRTGGTTKKVSGNAQYRRRDAIIQHGSLTYAVDAERHLACFVEAGIEPEAFESRVAGIRDVGGISRETAVSTLERTLAAWADADEGSWSEEERMLARERAERKYATASWNRERVDPLAR